MATPESPIVDLCAKSHCDGKRVEVSWVEPTGAVSPTPTYLVKRSRYRFALDSTDTMPTAYSGTDVSFSDTDLAENVAYYYTVFWSDDGGTTYYISDEARVIGLSIKDYEAQDGADWFYRMISPKVRALHEINGDALNVLKRHCKVMQCGLNILRGYVEGLANLNDPDRLISGKIGKPEKQYAIIEAALREMGVEPARALGLDAMRRLLSGITEERSFKGTCQGVVFYIQMIAPTWNDLECAEVTGFECGGGTALRTYDGESIRTPRTGRLQSDGGTLLAPPGSIEDATLALDPELYNSGVIRTELGQYICIDENDATSITFVDDTEQFLTSLPVTVLTAGALPFVVVPGSNVSTSFANMELRDIGGTVHTISSVGCIHVSANLLLVPLLSPAVVGPASIASNWVGASPEVDYDVLNGPHSTLLFPTFDTLLRGTRVDPFDYLFGGSGGSGSAPPQPFDTIVWVGNTAQETGEYDTVTATVLTDAAAAFTPGALVGSYLNPNRNQNILFRVSSNTATTITVEVGSDMTLVTDASSPGNYFVLSERDALRYDTINNTLPRYLPAEVNVHLWFD